MAKNRQAAAATTISDATIKAKTDKAGADALVSKYVDGPVVPQKLIAERELRFPQTTYVYGVDR